MPLVWPLAHKTWAKPEPGAKPIEPVSVNGEAKPRLTSGGKAVLEDF